MIKYFTPNNTEKEKRIYVSTIGYEEIAPQQQYPTRCHPEGYYFNPEEGRVLQEYQIVYFVEGEGKLHLKSGTYQLHPGTVIVISPGTWHSYYPTPETGWKQYWIGFKGDFVNEWMQDATRSTGKPVFRVGRNPEILALFRKAVEIADNNPDINLIGGLINYLVNMVWNVAGNTPDNEITTEHDEKINRACELLRDSLSDNLRIEEIASQVGLSYPHFRKLFKQKMNMSAQQYLMQLRMQKAADMLMSTDEPVKNVAYTLGYDQPAYFSYCFHKVIGLTPKEYRDSLRK